MKTMLAFQRKRKYIYCLLVFFFTYVVFSYIRFNNVIVNGAFFHRRTKAYGISNVVVHLDFKGAPPTLSYLRSILPILKKYGANGLLIEYEDMFPFKGPLAVVNARNVYSSSELQNFLTDAVQWGFEIIPLVQTFGHMQYVLKHEQYKDLRENANETNSICPSQQKSQDLIREMLKQIITFHSKITPLKFLHVGCDEVYEMNKCQYCKKRNSTDLMIFQQHVKLITEFVKKFHQETSVLIWDDMLRGNDKDYINLMPLPVDLVCWHYQLEVDIAYINLYKYKKNYNNVWAASAFKGADGMESILPNLTLRYQNHFSWMKFFERYPRLLGQQKPNFKGIILTGWSRYNHDAPVCDVLPVSMPSLIINLILVNKFNTHAFDDVARMTWNSFYGKHLKTHVHKALKCDGKSTGMGSVYRNNCSYEGSDLFSALNSLRVLERNLDYIIAKNIDNDSKYFERCKDMTGKNFSKTKQSIRLVEKNVAKAMSSYFDVDVINNYISQINNTLRLKINDMIDVTKC